MIYTKEVLDIFNNNLNIVQDKQNHFIARCFYCGDSKKHKSKAHLYVSKVKPVFRCVRCEESGRIEKLIFDITGVRKRLTSIINKENLKDLNSSIDETYIHRNFKKELLIPKQNPEMFDIKFKYLQDRFASNKIFDMLNENIIYDIKEFALANNIKTNKRKLFNYFQDKFVGFLTYNKSLMILRNTDTSSDFRYYIWKFGDIMNDFFMIDNLKEEKDNIDLVISEGVFDILNCYHHEDKFDLYTMASGKLFSRAIKFTMIEKCIAHFNKIIILSDDDVHLNFYKQNLLKFKNVSNVMQIWYNKNGKDFGQKNKVDKVILNLK